MKILTIKILSVISLIFIFSCAEKQVNGPYLATGIKIGEVSQTDAIVWVRLTKSSQRVGKGAPMPEVMYKNPETGELVPRKGRPDMIPVVNFPDSSDINSIEGAVPGSNGKARVKYRIAGEETWTAIDWQQVNPNRAFTTQFELTDLSPGMEYELLVEASPQKGEKISDTIEGHFKTAPSANDVSEVNFIVTTCTSYGDKDSDDGYQFYSRSLQLDPEFFVHAGDIVYYDGLGKTTDLARWHWDRMYSLSNHIDFHRQISSYFIKDDHDTWMNDCYPVLETKFMGEFTFDQGLQIFLDETPMKEKTYRTHRWGKDLQVWFVEGRDYRSPNPMPDGPEKTIWGEEQMAWFKSTVTSSDATFKVLISPTPIVGPDRENKNDNHANNGFQYEGEMLREFIANQANMVTVCGDRHWQFVSKDAETGIIEFSAGPGSDAHAGGWEQGNQLPEHIYLNVVGGFLEGEVSRSNDIPTLTFRHYDPKGEILHEYEIESRIEM